MKFMELQRPKVQGICHSEHTLQPQCGLIDSLPEPITRLRLDGLITSRESVLDLQ